MFGLSSGNEAIVKLRGLAQEQVQSEQAVHGLTTLLSLKTTSCGRPQDWSMLCLLGHVKCLYMT